MFFQNLPTTAATAWNIFLINFTVLQSAWTPARKATVNPIRIHKPPFRLLSRLDAKQAQLLKDHMALQHHTESLAEHVNSLETSMANSATLSAVRAITQPDRDAKPSSTENLAPPPSHSPTLCNIWFPAWPTYQNPLLQAAGCAIELLIITPPSVRNSLSWPFTRIFIF